MNLIPPKIHHAGRRPKLADIPDLITTACQAIHAPARCERLLQFYGYRSEGFTPARRFIEKTTGINSNKISEIRRELVGLGLIAYDAQKHEILVDWERIRLYATLDPDLTSQDRKHSYFAPACGGAAESEMGRSDYRPRCTEDRPVRQLSDAQQHFYRKVEAMTPSEWASIMRGIGIEIPPADETMLEEPEKYQPDWKDFGIDETCPKTYGPIVFDNPLPF